MSDEVFRALLVVLLPLALIVTLAALLRGATRIVRGWDALADGQR